MDYCYSNKIEYPNAIKYLDCFFLLCYQKIMVYSECGAIDGLFEIFIFFSFFCLNLFAIESLPELYYEYMNILTRKNQIL